MTEQSIELTEGTAIDPPEVDLPDNLDDLSEEMRSIEALPEDTSSKPECLPMSALEEIDLFQVRAGISSFHVESLARALAHDDDLQPVLVLRRGGRYFVIDGRHRIRAYEDAGRGESIPVVEFTGTLSEALLEGQRLNKRHTLAMTKDERMDCAWKLVKLDAAGACRFTLPQITAVGISRGQATFMRRVLRELDDAGFGHARWKHALRAHQKQPANEYTEEEIDEMNEAQAHEAADKVARVLGTRLADKPEVLARMIEIYSGRRISEVVAILNERNQPDEDEFPDF